MRNKRVPYYRFKKTIDEAFKMFGGGKS